jgi:putative aldouronate transport system substrate-binding protein
MIQDERYIYQYAYRPAQRTAIERWSQTDAPAHMIPGITPTEAEAAELGAIREDLSQCRYGWTVEFITGTKDLSEYAQFQTELENYGVARAIEIIQAAVDRYESR